MYTVRPKLKIRAYLRSMNVEREEPRNPRHSSHIFLEEMQLEAGYLQQNILIKFKKQKLKTHIIHCCDYPN